MSVPNGSSLAPPKGLLVCAPEGTVRASGLLADLVATLLQGSAEIGQIAPSGRGRVELDFNEGEVTLTLRVATVHRKRRHRRA